MSSTDDIQCELLKCVDCVKLSKQHHTVLDTDSGTEDFRDDSQGLYRSATSDSLSNAPSSPATINMITTSTSNIDKEKTTACFGPVDCLEDLLQDQWWTTLFDAMYLKTDGDVVEDPKITANEVNTLLSDVNFPKNGRVLDLCCGQGRHSLELARRRPDLRIFGVDQSAFLIGVAKEREYSSRMFATDGASATGDVANVGHIETHVESKFDSANSLLSTLSTTSQEILNITIADKPEMKSNVSFIVGDCRQLPFEGADLFDVIMVMGNSFGYFEREEADRTVLSEINRVLKPTGTLVLDLTDGAYMKQHFSPRSWEWIDPTMYVCRERELARDGRRLVSREIIANTGVGVVRDQVYAERLYELKEMMNLLLECGFPVCWQVETLTGEMSERGQDLGMMEHRMLIKAFKVLPDAISNVLRSPGATVQNKVTEESISVISPTYSESTPSAYLSEHHGHLVIVMGDPSLPSSEKLNQQWNPEDLETINKLQAAVGRLAERSGFQVTYLNQHDTLANDLASFEGKYNASKLHCKPLVFNLCDEGFYNHARLEMHVTALLDLAKLPYSGAGPACLGICYDKGLVNAIAGSMQVPVPCETLIPGHLSLEAVHHLLTVIENEIGFPAFVKPVRGDGSVGITTGSVVHDMAELVEHVHTIRNSENVLTKDVLVQEYLQGDEISVGIVGNPLFQSDGTLIASSVRSLPILRVDYSALPANLPPILAYESKWDPSSPYWTCISYSPAEITESQKKTLYQQCCQLFERMELCDYGRFDFRYSIHHGVFKLLEVNPNPGWCWDGKLALMYERAGLTYDHLIADIINSASQRHQQNRKSTQSSLVS
eukprot:gene2319-5302_t